MLLSGFFSSSETSLFSLNELKLEQMRRDDNPMIDRSGHGGAVCNLRRGQEGRYSSLAGFLLEKAGDVPAEGSSVEYKELVFTVTRGSARSIQEVKIDVKSD